MRSGRHQIILKMHCNYVHFTSIMSVAYYRILSKLVVLISSLFLAVAHQHQTPSTIELWYVRNDNGTSKEDERAVKMEHRRTARTKNLRTMSAVLRRSATLIKLTSTY